MTNNERASDVTIKEKSMPTFAIAADWYTIKHDLAAESCIIEVWTSAS